MEANQVSIVALGTGGCLSSLGNGTSWQNALALFISSQDVRESSRQLYGRTLKLYFEWVENTGRNLNLLTVSDILDYKKELLDNGMSSLTVSSYLTSIRKFYEWAESVKLYPNIGRGVHTPKRKQAFKKQHLTEEKAVELLDHYLSSSLRDYAIVNLLLRTGLRTIEVIRADIEDITFKGGRRILRVWGKGRDEKDDFVVLTDKAYLPIKIYLDHSRKNARKNEPLFTSESNKNAGGRLSTRSISRICKNGLVSIGLDGSEYTAHSLRHTTAVQILKRGGKITDAQDVLRHSNPATTQIYTESIKEELRIQNAPEGLLDSSF